MRVLIFFTNNKKLKEVCKALIKENEKSIILTNYDLNDKLILINDNNNNFDSIKEEIDPIISDKSCEIIYIYHNLPNLNVRNNLNKYLRKNNNTFSSAEDHHIEGNSKYYEPCLKGIAIGEKVSKEKFNEIWTKVEEEIKKKMI